VIDPVTPTSDRLHRLPKAELHVHLDGSLRPDTMADLANERGVDLPTDSTAALARYMLVDDAARLEDYLKRFDLTLAVMQDAEAIERIAYELVEDHAAENVRYVEIRFCPELNTRKGLSPEGAVEASLRGIRRAESDLAGAGTDIRAQLIVCGLRTHQPARTRAMAELAVEWHGRGVCGFDIAGAEAGHPVREHSDAFDLAFEAGLPITIHAGEGFGPASIRQALDVGHARRIGHGTRLSEDPELMARVAALRIPLETCITSNVQTRVVPSHRDHPAGRYMDAGIPVTLATDNRLMSGVTLTREYEHARDALAMSWVELVSVARAGFVYAFLPSSARDQLLTDFDREVAQL
jgi:adenosine deaminase